MQVGYSGKTLGRITAACAATSYTAPSAASRSAAAERVVLDAVFQVLQPARIEATLRALEQAESDHQARVRSAELQLEHAQIHTERARRQFDACEPENRLVARTLEREWEQRLRSVRGAERNLAEVTAKPPQPLADEEIAWCRRAGADLRTVFDAPTTSDRERKQLLGAILTDVVVTVERSSEQHKAELRVVWEDGQLTGHTVALPRTGSHTRCTDQDTVALVRQLAERYPDRQIAAILARQGRLTGAGNPFTVHRVAGLRAHHNIPACPVRGTSQDGEIVTIAKAASELGVSTATVHRWLREGFIVGEQITPGASWQIRLTDELRQRVRAHAPAGWLPLNDAAKALGVAPQDGVAQGSTRRARRRYLHHGKRKGLRIRAKLEQTGLFENSVREETQC
jgi:hypothetical protein